MKRALCTGIDDYPGTANDLAKCVKDAKDWRTLLGSLGFETQLLINSQVTRGNILAALEDLFSAAKAGDIIVFTYSGHGTSVFDVSGDEEDGYDEALYLYDGALVDDDLRHAIQLTPPGVNLVVIADSCFSGTVTRMAIVPRGKKPPRVRYMQTDIFPATILRKKKFLSGMTGKISARSKLRGKLIRSPKADSWPEEGMIEILLSGCSDEEYSYEGADNGAFTGAALACFVAGMTYNEFYAALRQLLPSSEYPQTPQLEGATANKKKVMFGLGEPEPEPVPGPEPEPGPGPTPNDPPRWFLWILGIVAIIGGILYLIFK
jgi:hypothetical protein